MALECLTALLHNPKNGNTAVEDAHRAVIATDTLLEELAKTDPTNPDLKERLLKQQEVAMNLSMRIQRACSELVDMEESKPPHSGLDFGHVLAILKGEK